MLKLVSPLGTYQLVQELSNLVLERVKTLDNVTQANLKQVVMVAPRLTDSQIADLLPPLYDLIRDNLNLVVRHSVYKGQHYVTLYTAEEVNTSVNDLIVKYKDNALTFVESVDLIVYMIRTERGLDVDMLELRNDLMEADIIDIKGNLRITRDQLLEMEPKDDNDLRTL